MTDPEQRVHAAERMITLGGRQFRLVNFDKRSVLQDHYLQSRIRAIGLDKAMPSEAESDVEYLTRLGALLVDSMRAHELLAGALLPDGVDESSWTPAIAAGVAAHVGACTAREDGVLVADLSMRVLFDHFARGLEMLRLSLSSSGATGPSQAK